MSGLEFKTLDLEPLPGSEILLYAFDVDGTLTPHPGDHPNSMWHQQSDYLKGLSPEILVQMRTLFSRLPPKFILISRNHEATIRQWLAELDPTFPDRIDIQNSSFRQSGVAPTGRGKRKAFLHLNNLGRPIIYIDDDLQDITVCQKMLTGPSYTAHIQSWLGDPSVYAGLQSKLQSFYLLKDTSFAPSSY